MPHIHVEYSGEGAVVLLDGTGESKIFDVVPYATGGWFGELKDPVYFAKVRLLPDGSGIEWPDGQDIAPHELYELGVEV